MSKCGEICVAALMLCVLSPAGHGDVYINEVMSDNKTAHEDPNEPGEYPDWIELYNDGAEVDLSGWYVTDNLGSPNQFLITSGTIPAGGYLLLYADNDPEQGPNHLGFKLSADGEAVGLSSDGITFVDRIILPELSSDHAFGRYPDGNSTWKIMTSTTPGSSNQDGVYLGQVADTKFSVDRGFYSNAFQVAITTATAGASIRYTTDFSEPSPTHGTIYSTPVDVAGTTVLRAMAYRSGWKSTDIDTQTYLFLDDVVNQPSHPSGGFPDWWGYDPEPPAHQVPGDYEMDPDIVSRSWTDNDGQSFDMKDALLDLPTLSFVTEMDNLFSTSGDAETGGIFINTGDGADLFPWERPVSLEWIDPERSDGFQANAGVRIYGGISRKNRYKKYSMRLLFKEIYGPTKLKFPVFGSDATDEFDTLNLRGAGNFSWHGWPGQQSRAQYMQEAWAEDTQIAMGQPGSHGRFIHLYVNGLYWGVYHLVERPDQSFGEANFGGDKEDYDALNSQDPTGSSTNQAWLDAHVIAEAGMNNQTHYNSLSQYIDIENLIDYMITEFYVANGDWDYKNWYVLRKRAPGATFTFYCWDTEDSLYNPNFDRVDSVNNANCPSRLYNALRGISEFRLQFADRAHRHLHNTGVLSPANTARRYQKRDDQLNRAIVAESARWGDAAAYRVAYDLPYYDGPYTREGHWIPTRDSIYRTFFPVRSENLIAHLRGANPRLYPNVDAPVFDINGAYQHGGGFSSGALLSMRNTTSDMIYYAFDGIDPREAWTGSIVGSAFGPGISLTRTIRVKARARSGGGEWSALNEAIYTLDTPSTLRITEIMYHPRPPQAGTAETNYLTSDFEFVELQNVSDSTIGLAGVRFIEGVRFDFTEGNLATLGAHDYVVLVSNLDAFKARYSNWASLNIAGTYHGRLFLPVGALSDGGEVLRLVDGVDRRIHDFDYEDDWYPHTDGEGYSLTIIDPYADADTWAGRASWRGSATRDGSPGADDPSPVYTQGTIVISEALTHQDTENPGDWIELYNALTTTVSIAGWYLSDNSDALTKFRIPDGVSLDPGEYVVFTEHDDFGATSTSPNPFALSEHGEAIYLSYGAGGSLAEPAYREYVEFGASDSGVTFGRHVKTDSFADFTAMTLPTSGTTNANPLIGPIVINEIMYHPTNGYHEYVELVNISDSPVPLYNTTNTWKLAGAGFTFPPGITMAAGEVVLLVRDTTTPEAFRLLNGVPGDVDIYGYAGSLDNGGERLQLMKPGVPDETGVPYIAVDMVNYKDSPVWSAEADGLGPAIEKNTLTLYGNDAHNWKSNVTGGTPGFAPTPGETLIYAVPLVISVSTPERVVPASASLSIMTVGASNLVYTITDDAWWLDISPATGTAMVGRVEHIISFSSGVTNFPMGTSNATLTISSGGAGNSPVTVALFLHVTELNNLPPTADAGPNQVVYIHDEVRLDGSGSTDGDAFLLNGRVAGHWSQVSGPSTVTILDPASTNATFVPTEAGEYVFRLEVSDGLAQDTDDVVVHVLFANKIPYQEPFERYAYDVSLIGTAGWYAARAEDGVVVTNDYSGSYGGGLPIPGADHERVLRIMGPTTNRFAFTGSKSNVWLDVMMECHRWSPLTPPRNESRDQLALYFNRDGNLCVWNDVGAYNDWTEIAGMGVAPNEWIRLTIELDYGASPGRFRVYKNGGAVPDSSTWFDVANDTRRFLSGISMAGGFHLDDLVVADYDPQSAFIAWMRDHYPGTNDYNNAAASDTDGDGITAEGEFNVGTDPTNMASVFAIIEAGRTGASNSVTWYGTSNNVSTPFAIYRATNLLDEVPWGFVTNVNRDPMGTGINQWWDDSPPSNAPSFYRVVAPNE